MRFTVAASALFAGLAVAMPAVTVTQQSTEVDTITSCGAEVTNCPARSTSVPAVPVEATSVPVETPAGPSSYPVAPVPESSVDVPTPTPAASSSSPVAPVPESSVDVPFPTPAANASTTALQSTVYLYSTQEITITSCAPEVTNCPAKTSQTSFVTGTSIVPVQSVATLTASTPAAPFPTGAGNGTIPAGTAAPSGSSPSASATYPATFTGAASSLNAGMALAGVGAFAAFLL